MTSTGPAIRVVCRILNQNSCGSGSICGIQPSGKALIMTNAHVAGTRLGRVVKVWVESKNDTINAKVIAAGYSNQISSDWAILETLEPYTKVEPVKLYKNMPSGSHYTKGFPRCRQHNGTDIRTVRISNGVWFWEPDAIGGQSGSGVWNDNIERQEGLLTWQWGGHGAGQPTAAIYAQATSRMLIGEPRPEGLVELPDYEGLQELDRTGCDDPVVEDGIFMEANGIADLPIWWSATDPGPDPDPDPDPDPNDPAYLMLVELLMERERDLVELHQKYLDKLSLMLPMLVKKDFSLISPDDDEAVV